MNCNSIFCNTVWILTLITIAWIDYVTPVVKIIKIISQGTPLLYFLWAHLLVRLCT